MPELGSSLCYDLPSILLLKQKVFVIHAGQSEKQLFLNDSNTCSKTILGLMMKPDFGCGFSSEQLSALLGKKFIPIGIVGSVLVVLQQHTSS